MTTRTVSLSEDAYLRLRRLKQGRESFSDVVLRLTGKADLMSLAGTLSEGFADDLERHAASFRDRFDADARARRP